MDSLVNESNDDALDINSLPDEVILEIFRYLKQNQLGQIARVCSRWNVLTRRPVLWKKVNVQIFPSHRSLAVITKSFIDRLPSCVTYIRLDFGDNLKWDIKMFFEELCMRLQENCPHLEALILIRCKFSDNLSSIIHLCTHFLPGVKKLLFYVCLFYDYYSTAGSDGISKIEVFGLWCCLFESSEGGHFKKPPFSKMPYLNKLHLSGPCDIDDSWFKDDPSFLNQLHVLTLQSQTISTSIFSVIKNHGINIKELCLYSFRLHDHDINFNNSEFPQLTTICLRDCYHVTCEGVVSLIQSCLSLQNVYVNDSVAETFAAHPFAVANRCKSGIVKKDDCNHGKEDLLRLYF